MNFKALEEYLAETQPAEDLAEELDRIIFDVVYIYAQSNEALCSESFGELIYTLKTLRNIFKQTAIDNIK